MIEVKYQATEEVKICFGSDAYYRLTIPEARIVHARLGEILYGSEDKPRLVRS